MRSMPSVIGGKGKEQTVFRINLPIVKILVGNVSEDLDIGMDVVLVVNTAGILMGDLAVAVGSSRITTIAGCAARKHRLPLSDMTVVLSKPARYCAHVGCACAR
jgi:hypothetical protein